MADVKIIDNTTRLAGDELIDSLQWATEVRIATAFAKKSGVTKIVDAIERMLAAGGQLRVVYGLDFYITDAEAMREFTRLADAYPTVTHYAYSAWSLSLGETFHPKLYICADRAGNTQVLLGSSNLTQGGLWSNIEANAVVTGTVSDAAIVQAGEVFERVITTRGRFVPDAEYLERYSVLRRKASKFPPRPKPPRELSGAYQSLKRHEERLQGPGPTQKRVIIDAIKNLSGSEDRWVPLKDIVREAERLARAAGAGFDWATFSNSVRGRINEHTKGKGGADMFERYGGVEGRRGLYRLADAGRRYEGR